MPDLLLKAGTLQTLANANGGSISNGVAVAAGTNLDNRTELGFTYDFELNCGFGTSVSAGAALDLFLVPILDGTNAAEQNAASNVFQAGHYRGTFTTATTGTGTRRLTVEGVTLGPYLYTAYVSNRTGVTVSVNWTLRAWPVKSQY